MAISSSESDVPGVEPGSSPATMQLAEEEPGNQTQPGDDAAVLSWGA
jgi:hypothetical protein